MRSEQETKLFASLIYLADTLVSGFDVIDLADRLVGTCQDLLDVSTAGLLLDDQHGGLRVIASSSETMRMLELLELEADEGPCVDAFETGEQVSVPFLATTLDRWPRFTPRALADGLVAVYALPLRLRERTVGALNLFCDRPDQLSENDLRIAHVLASMATIGLINHRAIKRQELLAEQRQTALNSRVVIEQAKGVIAERTGVDMAVAFDLLRGVARSSRRPLSELAGDVVAGRVATDDLKQLPSTDPALKN